MRYSLNVWRNCHNAHGSYQKRWILFAYCVSKKSKKVEEYLTQGDIDYADLTQWSFPDEFLCLIWERQLLEFVNRTYPNPRQRNDVPIWFLICCQFVMRLHQTGHYHHLGFLLNSGSLLTRFGFNVGSKVIGFNKKNVSFR